MDLVTGALGKLGPKLLKLLHDEYKLQKGVKKQIESLSVELEGICVALRKVGEVPPEQLDQQVRLWARDVREASYDMEDVVDTFLVRVGGCEPADNISVLERAINKMVNLFRKSKARHDIAVAIKGIMEQIQVVAERRARCKVDEIVVTPAATSAIDRRLNAMYKEVTQLVGINKAMDDVISLLSLQGGNESVQKKRVVSIVGIGGLGKTTLAKALYDKMKPNFDCQAFVSVGRKPDLKKVFREILIELDKDKYSDIKYTTFQEKFFINELRGEPLKPRYLIVIDDVWETESWENINMALVDHNNGSRVITTTRNFKVAEVVTSDIYKLQPLSDDNSERLFYTRIFGSGYKNHINKKVDEVSDKILKKCHGVPLAIITMASLLVDKPWEVWVEVCNSTGFRDKDNKQVDDTMWILSLSYYDLPCHLKTCLLYLSVFPEDYTIDKHSLVWKWVDEDFVEKKPGVGLFEVGEGYFIELINRCMIQPVEYREDGIVNGCRVHDMVLDLICSLSRERNFVTILGNNDEGTLSQSCSVRRLAHQNITIKDTQQDSHNGMTKVRSFVTSKCNIKNGVSLPNFTLLRVLALEHCLHVGYNLENIGDLHHLRYLGLRYARITNLPRAIGALRFLHTLELEEIGIQELPSSISLLSQLICLRAWGMWVPNGVIDKLTHLEELQIYSSDDDIFVKELGHLSELRMLRARLHAKDDRVLPDLLLSLCKLKKLQRLTVDGWISVPRNKQQMWDAEVVLSRYIQHLFLANIQFSGLPSCITPSHLPYLSHLQLVLSMNDDALKLLSGLPQLCYLSLSTYSTVALSNVAAAGCFRKLRSLWLVHSLVQFVLNKDSSVSFTIWNGGRDLASDSKKKDKCLVAPVMMPKLEELYFVVPMHSLMVREGSCDNLGLEYLTSLEKVRVRFECRCVNDDDVYREKDALTNVINKVHPNRPTLQIDLEGDEYHRMWLSTEERVYGH
ncbi:unnamed protein product [Urochloa humidicola]